MWHALCSILKAENKDEVFKWVVVRFHHDLWSKYVVTLKSVLGFLKKLETDLSHDGSTTWAYKQSPLYHDIKIIAHPWLLLSYSQCQEEKAI